MDFLRLQAEVLEANLELVRRGLVLYTFGNASGIDREAGIIAIKPSGVPYERMTAADIVLCDLDGKIIEGRNPPPIWRRIWSFTGPSRPSAAWCTPTPNSLPHGRRPDAVFPPLAPPTQTTSMAQCRPPRTERRRDSGQIRAEHRQGHRQYRPLT